MGLNLLRVFTLVSLLILVSFGTACSKNKFTQSPEAVILQEPSSDAPQCESQSPATSESRACLGEHASQNLAIQRFAVECVGPNWVQNPIGGIDYSLCPAGCDQTTKPSSQDNVKCSMSEDILAKQNYNVSCNAAGQWEREILGAKDESLCPAVDDPPAGQPTTTQGCTMSPVSWIANGKTCSVSMTLIMGGGGGTVRVVKKDLVTEEILGSVKVQCINGNMVMTEQYCP